MPEVKTIESLQKQRNLLVLQKRHLMAQLRACKTEEWREINWLWVKLMPIEKKIGKLEAKINRQISRLATV